LRNQDRKDKEIGEKRNTPIDHRKRKISKKQLESNEKMREKKDACKDWRNSHVHRLLVSTLSDLRSLDSRHLLSPGLGRLGFLDGAEIISGEARDTHVIVTLKDKLDVAQFESRGGAELGEATSLRDDLVDEVVGHLEDELGRCQLGL
jgi:hypothetical protein